MSVANRYKVLTLSGAQCFAMLRAMATRETILKEQLNTALAHSEDGELLKYLNNQLADIRATREHFNSTPFSEGAKS